MDKNQESHFIVGESVSVSELAKYWGRVLQHASTTGQEIVIARRGQPTHVLVPLGSKNRGALAGDAAKKSIREACHGS